MKEHTITEQAQKWIVIFKTAKMDVRYEIPKELCKTFEDVERFITEKESKGEV